MKKQQILSLKVQTDVNIDIRTHTTEHYAGMPRSVRIGPYQFVVEMMSDSDAKGNREFGHCNLIGQRIRLSPGMTPQKLANTFIHECMHGMHWVSGLSDSSDEEDFTHLTANALCSFWIDNPAAVSWIARMLTRVPE